MSAWSEHGNVKEKGDKEVSTNPSNLRREYAGDHNADSSSSAAAVVVAAAAAAEAGGVFGSKTLKHFTRRAGKG